MKSTVTISDLSGEEIRGDDDSAVLTVSDPQDNRKMWVLDISKAEAEVFVGKGKLKGRPGRPKGKVT